MKAKKVVVGTMTAALLSLMASSLPVIFAASDTVQISVGTATVNPGEEFSVDVSLADIPATGIQGCDFTVKYDNTVLTVDSVTAGPITETGADSSDSTSSLIPVFDSEVLSSEGAINLAWSTGLESQYWIKSDGVFCTITGKVSADAKAGTESKLEVTATPRQIKLTDGTVVTNTVIGAGYTDGSKSVKYATSVANGSVKIGGSQETTTATQDTTNGKATLYGDADVDSKVGISDVVKVMMYVANKNDNPLTEQGYINADVYSSGDGVFISDALSIQKKVAQILETLPES